MNKILLVSEDEDFAKKLKSKLIFLRNNDSVVISNYNDALFETECSKSNIVLVHEFADKTIELLSKLRKNSELCLILLSNNPEIIMAAADIGVDDFISPEAQDYEYVLRIVQNVKYNNVKTKSNRNVKILEQLKVIDELTGAYNYDYRKTVIENYAAEKLIQNGIFMALSAVESDEITFENLSKAIMHSKRIEDTVILGKDLNFYIFMPDSNINGAIVLFNRIKAELSFDIFAGISEISNKEFDQYEAEALKSLTESKATGSEFMYKEQVEQNDLLEDNSGKSYKFFKLVFNNKFENIIIPVFNSIPEIYESKLTGIKINQFIQEENCVLNLRNNDFESSLKIVYTGLANIVVYIKHEGLDRPENQEIKIPLSKITKDKLYNIVEDFIKEFKGEIC